MEHVCSSRIYGNPINDSNNEDSHDIRNSSHQEEPPLFLGFPSPFFDDIDTIPMRGNTYTHQHHRAFNITDPTPSESKRVKKRSVGKKDRHSKIHTAQGLRDRRMRLSLHIARKFFDLQDLLGFDKASKTIEWLFCKSNKAIKEVADNFDPKDTNQSMTEEMMAWRLTDCEVGYSNETKVPTNKPENFKVKNKESRKRIQNNTSSREQARARARERTRERLMIKELEKSKFLFEGNPNDHEIHKLGLGYMVSPDNRNLDEVTSSASEPVQQQSSSPSDLSTHHLLRELQLANTNVDIFKSYNSVNIVGAPVYCTTMMNHDPPAGWLNSSYGFVGIPGGCDADNIMNESCNYAIDPRTAPLTTGDIYDQNPSSIFMSTATNFLHFQTQNQDK